MVVNSLYTVNILLYRWQPTIQSWLNHHPEHKRAELGWILNHESLLNCYFFQPTGPTWIGLIIFCLIQIHPLWSQRVTVKANKLVWNGFSFASHTKFWPLDIPDTVPKSYAQRVCAGFAQLGELGVGHEFAPSFLLVTTKGLVASLSYLPQEIKVWVMEIRILQATNVSRMTGGRNMFLFLASRLRK